MNLADVMDDLGLALSTIDGLRVFPYWADKIVPPAVVVAWPEPLEYDSTMGRGSDRQSVPVIVIVGKIDARTSRDLIAQYANGAGVASIKQVIESYEASAYDSARVTQCDFGTLQVNGNTMLSATFTVDIIGTGA